MRQLSYLGVLGFIVIGTLWLEVLLRTRVIRRWKRLLLTLVPVIALFTAWDLYAIAAGHWWFDPDQTTGIVLPGGVPIEEILFFAVIPLAAILTLEAVRSVKGWPAGDGDDRDAGDCATDGGAR